MTFSHWESVAAVIRTNPGGPPEQVMPQVARTLAAAMAARMGLLRGIVSQLLGGNSDAGEGVRRGLEGSESWLTT